MMTRVLSYVLTIVALTLCHCDGFIGVSTNTKSHGVANDMIATPPLTLEQIAACQRDAEATAKANIKTMESNAIFLSVPERPDPTPCRPLQLVKLYTPSNKAWSAMVRNDHLPADFPPGCLLRLGPNGSSREDGFMDGDGMIHCITFPPQSKANLYLNRPATYLYSSTYITTHGREMEQGSRRRFKGGLGVAPRGFPMLQNLIQNMITFWTLEGQKDTANTALAEHNGRVLALMEQSLPSEIAVYKNGTVKTIQSRTSLNGAIPNDNPVTGGVLGAHGRTCPRTGERIHVSYSFFASPNARIDIFQPKKGDSKKSSSISTKTKNVTASTEKYGWHLKKSIPVYLRTGVPIMIHDCAITDNYVIVLDFPLTFRVSRLLNDRFPIEYEPENGARIGLVPRNPKNKGYKSKRIRWFDCQPGVVLHSINAYEDKDENKLVLQALRSEPRGCDSFIQSFASTFLYEWVLDLETGQTTERCLNPSRLVEFPVIDAAQTGKAVDAVYCMAVSSTCNELKVYKAPQEGIIFDGIIKLALQNDKLRGIRKGDVIGRYVLPKNWYCVSEPTVVPKTSGTGTYILIVATWIVDKSPASTTVTMDAIEEGFSSMKSRLIVLDGDKVDKVVFALDLPYHVPCGLHSMFLDWDKMK